jgi:Raf kinase inhibitor-like YbhB/YbcL family protein
MRRPFRSLTSAGVLFGVGVASLISACDTGDGRELSPPVVPPPTSTIAPTIDSVSPADAVTTVPIQPFTLVAPWLDGAEIPVINTCDGDDISPALNWSNVPDNTVELALVVRDDDADGFIHWVVTALDPAFGSMLEGQVPQGAVQWPNSFGAPEWNGPCPPPGTSHTYRFVLHALNQSVDEVAADAPTADLLDVIDAFTMDAATITATYTR